MQINGVGGIILWLNLTIWGEKLLYEVNKLTINS